MLIKQALAAVLAGIGGTVANAIAVALVLPVDLMGLLVVPGRYGVAILVAGTMPFLFRWLPLTAATLTSLIVLTVVPSALAKLVFGVGADWALVLFLNAVFAVVALGIYWIFAGRGARARSPKVEPF